MNEPLDASKVVPTYALRGGLIFTADGQFVPSDVLVAGGKIEAVGRLQRDDRERATELDCTGLVLFPGFIDCHVHVTITTLNVIAGLDTPLSYRFYEAAQNLKATLHAGVTTVRDAAGADAGIKRALASGMIEGPRLLTAIGMISQTGGHGDRTMPCGVHLPLMPEYPGNPRTIADGPDEVRRVVRTLIRDGADVIKVATSGGVMSPRGNPRHGHFRPAELDVLVEEATAAGLPTMAHAHSAAGVKAAVRAGITSVEHGAFLDEEAIAAMVAARTYLVPTLVSGQGVLAAGGGISPENLRKVNDGIASHHASISAAVSAGVRIAMGTDSGVTAHGRNLEELALMEGTGLSPERVLLSATLEAARLLGIDDRVGALEPGKLADIVAVSGDPLDLAAIPNAVQVVVAQGKIARDSR